MVQRRINVRAIIWHDDKLLAVKHKTKTGDEAAYWAVPGGGLDAGESLTDGIAREILEETGIHAHVGRLLFMQQFPGRPGYDEELEFFYHIENGADFQTIDLASTTHGNDELARIEFINPKDAYILPTILSQLEVKDFVNSVQPVYLHNELPRA